MGHQPLQVFYRFGSTDTCNYVFTLGIDEEFSVEEVFSSGRVPGEAYARGRVVSHVAEDHRLDVYGSPQEARNVIQPSILYGPWGIPGLEDGVYCHIQLGLRVGGEIPSRLFLVQVLIFFCQFLEVLCGESCITICLNLFL